MRVGSEFLETLQKAVPLMLETRQAWVVVEASFPPVVIDTWTKMAVLWEARSENPNPFASTVKHDSLRDVKRRLAEIAREDVQQLNVRGDMHETEMLSMGLQLEEQQ